MHVHVRGGFEEIVASMGKWRIGYMKFSMGACVEGWMASCERTSLNGITLALHEPALLFSRYSSPTRLTNLSLIPSMFVESNVWKNRHGNTSWIIKLQFLEDGMFVVFVVERKGGLFQWLTTQQKLVEKLWIFSELLRHFFVTSSSVLRLIFVSFAISLSILGHFFVTSWSFLWHFFVTPSSLLCTFLVAALSICRFFLLHLFVNLSSLFCHFFVSLPMLCPFFATFSSLLCHFFVSLWHFLVTSLFLRHFFVTFLSLLCFFLVTFL